MSTEEAECLALEVQELRAYKSNTEASLESFKEQAGRELDAHNTQATRLLPGVDLVTPLAQDQECAGGVTSVRYAEAVRLDTMEQELASAKQQISELRKYKDYAKKMLADADMEVDALQKQIDESEAGAEESQKEELLQVNTS